LIKRYEQYGYLFLALNVVVFLFGCKASYPPVPKPVPLNAPVNTDAAVKTLLSSAQQTPTTQNQLNGTVTRKALVHWLAQRQGGLPQLARPSIQLADVSDPNLSAFVALSPWRVAFFPAGIDGHSRFMPNKPVTRAEFCIVLSVFAGQWPALQQAAEEQINAMAPAYGPAFENILDAMSVPGYAKRAMAWAYKQTIVQQAFDVSTKQLEEEGIRPGKETTWEEIKPLLEKTIPLTAKQTL
jgi:hypothetical protein